MFSHTRLFRQDLLVASLFRNFLLVERIMRFANCSPISYPMLPPTHQHHKWDAWDMAAEICLAQLPALVEDPNAEFQAVRSGGNGNAVEANPCLSSDEKPEIEVDVDGSLPFYILDSHEEFYGANAGSLYLFGKNMQRYIYAIPNGSMFQNDIVTKLERDAEESKISPTTFSTKLHCFGAFSY